MSMPDWVKPCWENSSKFTSLELARSLIPAGALEIDQFGAARRDGPYAIHFMMGDDLFRIMRHYDASAATGPYWLSSTKGRITPGRAAYEKDVQVCPIYLDGMARTAWDKLTGWARETWEYLPIPREPEIVALWGRIGQRRGGECKGCVDHRGCEGFNPCPCNGDCPSITSLTAGRKRMTRGEMADVLTVLASIGAVDLVNRSIGIASGASVAAYAEAWAAMCVDVNCISIVADGAPPENWNQRADSAPSSPASIRCNAPGGSAPIPRAELMFVPAGHGTDRLREHADVVINVEDETSARVGD